MESINNLSQLLADILKEVKQLDDAYTELDRRIAKEARHIDRLDRIVRISALKARLVSEIDRIKHEEDSSEGIFNTGKLYNGILGFAVGGIVGAIAKQNPLLSGFRSFNTELDKKESFGNVMIAAKENGELEDIEVIAVSHLAREAKKTESAIITSLVSKGYSLMTPEELWKSLDQFKEEIMEGKYRSETEQVKALLHCVKKRNKCTI